MSKSLLDKATEKTIKHSGLIVIWLVLLVGFFLSAYLGYEDYLGSVAGYERLPTEPITGYTAIVFGALPQVGQIILALFVVSAIDIKAGNTWVYVLLMVLFFVADAGTDFIYLIGPNPTIWHYVVAFFQAVFVYTLLSEWMLMSTAALLLKVTPPAIKEWVRFIKQLMDSVNDVAGLFQGSNNTTPETRVRAASNRQDEEPRLPPSRRN
jgi:hypothetical protein